jgi:hypothetical protein
MEWESTEGTMVRIYFLLAILALALSFTSDPACAGDLQFHAGGGGGVAIGDLANRAGIGFHGLFTVSYPLNRQASGGIAVAIRSEYHRFVADAEIDGDFVYLLAGPDLRISYDKGGGALLYLLLSGGYAYTERKGYENNGTEIPAVQENNLYATAGLGAEMGGKARLRPFVEVRFTDVSGAYVRDHLFFSGTIGIRL